MLDWNPASLIGKHVFSHYATDFQTLRIAVTADYIVAKLTTDVRVELRFHLSINVVELSTDVGMQLLVEGVQLWVQAHDVIFKSAIGLVAGKGQLVFH